MVQFIDYLWIIDYKINSMKIYLFIATNDIGIMVLPNGKAVAFAIFITNSHEVADVNYEIIAEIAKVIFLAYQ